jgi:hypothetical protein
MVTSNSFLAISAFAMGALAQPSIHRNLIGRATTTSSASVPAATSWNPPSNMVKALDQVSREIKTHNEENFLTMCLQVRERTLSENPDGLSDKNWITDQLMANNGSINYCVRWNTALTSSAANRTKTEAALQRSLNSWVETLLVFEGFPLTKANVKVVGYAVTDKSLLEGDTSGLDVYTTADADGVPECDTRCYRGAHLDDPQGLASCPGGEASRYDISLWLDDSLTDVGGYGYNWGEELPPTYFFQTIDDENVHILLHEMGHGFGLLGEFYRLRLDRGGMSMMDGDLC